MWQLILDRVTDRGKLILKLVTESGHSCITGAVLHESLCASWFAPAVITIAQNLATKSGHHCVTGAVLHGCDYCSYSPEIGPESGHRIWP